MSKRIYIRSDIADLIEIIAKKQGKSEEEVIAATCENMTKELEG